LKNGGIAEVVIVRKPKDILRAMTERQALAFSSRVRSIYGAKWIQFYYQAEVMVGDQLTTVEPNMVKSISDPP